MHHSETDFDCLEVTYTARMHGSYVLQVLTVSDVGSLAFEDATSAIQLGAWATVEVYSERFAQAYRFQGKIQVIEDTSKLANGKALVWIECVPECHELFINRRSGIYLGASALDLIERGLTGRFRQLQYQHTSVSPSIARPRAFYPSQNSLTQFAESDLAFILRHLAEYGIWANFRQDISGKGGVTLVLGDHNLALNELSLLDLPDTHNPEALGLYNVRLVAAQITDSVRAIYFDESVNRYSRHSADLPTLGGYLGLQIDHHCLSNRLTDAEVSRIARIVKESLQLQQQKVFASFRGLNLQPGDVFQAPLSGSVAKVYKGRAVPVL